jgi:hypothetical protein
MLAFNKRNSFYPDTIGTNPGDFGINPFWPQSIFQSLVYHLFFHFLKLYHSTVPHFPLILTLPDLPSRSLKILLQCGNVRKLEILQQYLFSELPKEIASQ